MTREFFIGRLVGRSLIYYRRSNTAIVAGVAVAVAVLVGSLAVGDSVRGSLREIALERLGEVRQTVTTNGFFADSLAGRLAEGRTGSVSFVPVLSLDGAARNPDNEVSVPDVRVLGVPESFWRIAPGGLRRLPDGRSVVLNEDLAEALGVGEGGELLLSIARRDSAPAGSLFGRTGRADTMKRVRLRVDEVIPTRGIGRFSLRSDQQKPRNVYVSLSWLQAQAELAGRANTVLVTGQTGPADLLRRALVPVARLDDFGLHCVPGGDGRYVALRGGNLTLPARVVDGAQRIAERGGYPAAITSVYLANTLTLLRDGRPVGAGMPYSVVLGADAWGTPPLGPLPVQGGDAADLGADDVLLNEWAASDLGAKPGDRIEMSFFVADGRGELSEEPREFTLRGVLRMEGTGADGSLVPAFEGITDTESVGDWDPPFPLDKTRVRAKDDEYWREYRAAPKAFLSADTVREMWQPQGIRGAESDWITSVLFAVPDGSDAATFADSLSRELAGELTAAGYGLRVDDVRRQALDAAKGSSDFGVLFISMSMFLVASAAMLVGLLGRLTIERRARQYGVMTAAGFEPRAAAGVLMREGRILALAGAVVGAPLGVGYAAAIMAALRTSWRGALGSGLDLSLHTGPASVLIGAAGGFAVAWLAMRWAARLLRRSTPVALLAGWSALAAEPRCSVRRRARLVGVTVGALGIVLLLLSGLLHAIPTTGAFFGGGAALLTGALALSCALLVRREETTSARRVSLGLLAWRGASRNWVRSLLTVGLLASASFVIVAVGANRRDVSITNVRNPASGAGGFNLRGVCDLPVYRDLNTASGRDALGFRPESQAALADADVVSLRMSGGDDASCLNVQQPSTPRVLGVPDRLVARGGFGFTELLDGIVAGDNPWEMLNAQLPDDSGGVPVVPAFADAGSAKWIMKKGLGDDISMTGADGAEVKLRLVGLMRPSIFASELLISERNFGRCFGADSGYRYFLVATPEPAEKAVREALSREMGDMGLRIERTGDVLAGFAGVQNTYLMTFQTLGGLGLLLGTFGVVAVLLRGVVERRRELAMMLALGLRRYRLVAMIVIENGLLLILGVIIGTVTAVIAVAPQLLSAQAAVQWLQLAGTLAACVVAGVASCMLAAALSVRRDLLAALRSE